MMDGLNRKRERERGIDRERRREREKERERYIKKTQWQLGPMARYIYLFIRL